MEWAEAIGEAVRFMESHITENITVNDVAEHVHISPFYFHKGFSMLCGYSVTEYIRNRRLSLAGEELMTKEATILTLAVKYGYDSADSFSRAFRRFHGVLPKAVKRGAVLKNFAPLKLTISMKGQLKVIYLKDIVYIEAFGDGTYIYTNEEVIESKNTLKYWNEKLGTEHFFQTHKSYIIALRYVKKIDTVKVKMKSVCREEEIPVSRRKRTQLKDAVLRYVRLNSLFI